MPLESVNIILASWRQSTKMTYKTYLSAYLTFAKQFEFNPFQPKVVNVIKFLTKLYKKGLGYSTINTARSAINQLLSVTGNKDFTNSSLLNRFMKGIFEQKPPLPKYKKVWDVKTVLDYLETMPHDSLLMLSGKLVTLFLLVSAQRGQTLHVTCLEDIEMHSDKIIIYNNHLLKQTKKNRHLPPIILHSFESNNKLCIVNIFQEYLSRTKDLRDKSCNKLLVSTQKPHKGVSRATVSRWVKCILQKAGIEDHYSPHSVRAASVSKAYMAGVSLENILKTAGWKNDKVFKRFYKKPVDETLSVHKAILC